MWLVEERCAIIFLSNQTYDFHLVDNKRQQNKADVQWRKDLRNELFWFRPVRNDLATTQNIVSYRQTFEQMAKGHIAAYFG